ncbi:tetratricopeptide repeat protein [Nesterenkonia lutea]|uniref:Tetratricopeptide (TPR) repeat protein n=1 Tax=Nesterenkonia lutea TaxID=272919 RepID=A0ABR9JBW1_9MICC|nr:hypothetical protein [Nesterenkonia lutea]MBE1523419.1 tetratricopeptide (TPR) repeat protein [Nesterenkonia lutea]
MLKPLVLAAELGRRTVGAATAIPGIDSVLARAVMATGGIGPSQLEAAMTGERSKLGSFQDKAATVLLEANPRGASALLARLDIDSAQDADKLERLASQYFKLKHYDAALSMRRRAVQLEPEDPLRWIALARSLLRATGGHIVHDPVAGLVEGPLPRTEEAREALAQAEPLAPENAFVLHERGQLEFEHGDAAVGLDLMERALVKENRATWWTDLGSAYRKPHIADYDRSLDAYEKALQLKPTSPTAFRGVIIMGCRADQDWPRLWRSAELFESSRGRNISAKLDLARSLSQLFTAAPAEQEIDEALAALEAARGVGLRLSWPATSLIVYRLQFLQRMQSSFALRRELAQRTVTWLGTSSAGHTRHRQKLLSALIYLGREDEALKLIDPMPWTPYQEVDRQRLLKMSADTHLIRGNLKPYQDYSAQRRAEVPLPGEPQMERLIRDQRIAVVGPADTGDRLGELIDSYDVVIRPRLMTEFDEEQRARLGSRTDIAYFSGRDIDDFRDEASAAVEAGRLQMVIGRGLSMASAGEDLPDWLRFYSHDYSLGFHGPPMGIGRILYDVLQFHPEQVSLFNIDFFSGQKAFGKGYRPVKDQQMGPYSIVNEVVLAHDLAFEHRLTKAMAVSGVLDAKGVAGEVLALTEEQYIQRLETSSALTTRTA